MLAALGLFVFEMASFPFSEFTRRSGWNHARGDRFGARPAAQFTGPGNDEITIGGSIVPEAGGSYGAIETLRAMADQGERYPLLGGDGVVIGTYVITSLEEGRKALLVDGTPRMVDFSIQLERVD